jgi:hypothetical protein
MPDILFPSKRWLCPKNCVPSPRTPSDGNGVVINLVPNDRLKEFRDTNIKVVQERDDLKAFQETVVKVFPEFDPETP